MKATFRQQLINDPFGDPSLLIRIAREKKALLFDLGDIRCLSSADLHKVTDVFVSHTHIDHFIGFDTLLRIILRREIPLNIYGPAGIIGNIAGKLRGFTWNLIKDYPTTINVFGVDRMNVTHAVFRAANGFRKKILQRASSDGPLLDSLLFTVSALRLTHGTPCLAFRLNARQEINIDKDRLLKKGLTVGPWLTELKRRLREQGTEGSISVYGKPHKIRSLMDIVRTGKGPIISYATDIALKSRNIQALASFIKGSDILYCEAYFLEKDRERARERFHLTAAECGRIARDARVKTLALMHFSPLYRAHPELLIEEASKAFGGQVICGPFQLRQSSRQRQSV